MKDKGHFYISLVKSLVRIVGCILFFANIALLPIMFGIAEVLGIFEELADKR